MKSNKCIVASAALILALGACHKGDRTPPPHQNFNPIQQELLGDKKLLPQKTIEMTTQEAIKLIKNFKSGISSQNNQIVQEKLIEADSVQLDSSIFVVEAALNYDFDYSIADSAFNTLPSDTSEFTIPITKVNQKVSSDDLEGAYVQLQYNLNSLITGTARIRVVDLLAYITGNQVVYRAVIYRQDVYPTVVDCVPFNQTGAADPGNTAFPFAGDLINYKLLNCKFAPCPSTWYFNVSTTVIDNSLNNHTGVLYFIPNLTPGSNWTDNTQLSSSQMTTYLNNIHSYINSITPFGFKVSNCAIFKSFTTYYNWPGYPWPSSIDFFWNLNITFAQTSVTDC